MRWRGRAEPTRLRLATVRRVFGRRQDSDRERDDRIRLIALCPVSRINCQCRYIVSGAADGRLWETEQPLPVGRLLARGGTLTCDNAITGHDSKDIASRSRPAVRVTQSVSGEVRRSLNGERACLRVVCRFQNDVLAADLLTRARVRTTGSPKCDDNGRKPESGSWIHFFSAKAWIAQTYVSLGRYRRSGMALKSPGLRSVRES